jgi:hypothetical protein
MRKLFFVFFAHTYLGTDTYKTPQKRWLNNAAILGKQFSNAKVESFKVCWENSIENSLIVFSPEECFRRQAGGAINKALFDLVMHQVKGKNSVDLLDKKEQFRDIYYKLIKEDPFSDLISRAVDHKSRTTDRFQIWDNAFSGL